MTTWFVSRHPGALHWMKKNNIHFDIQMNHFDPMMVQAGDVVIGSLPINLAAQICALGAEYQHLSLFVPKHARGKELSAEELDTYSAKLERFQVTKL